MQMKMKMKENTENDKNKNIYLSLLSSEQIVVRSSSNIRVQNNKLVDDINEYCMRKISKVDGSGKQSQ